MPVVDIVIPRPSDEFYRRIPDVCNRSHLFLYILLGMDGMKEKRPRENSEDLV